MANYIGNIPSQGEFKKLDSIASSFDGTTTQFNLNYNSVSQPVGGAEQLIVSLNGVIQEPLTSYILGIGGSSIVFSSAPQSGDTCHIVLFGGIGQTVTPSDQSVTPEKLSAELKDYYEDEFTANGSTTDFTLSREATGINQLMVSIDGILQPTSAYTVSGTTFTVSPALPDGTNIRVVHMGVKAGVFVPQQNSVGLDEIITSELDSRYYTETEVDATFETIANVALKAPIANPSFTGNVGIGTSSPSAKLEVAGTTASTNARVTTTTGRGNYILANDGGVFTMGLDDSAASGFGGGAYTRNIYSNGAYPLRFWTNDAERARIDSSGNLLVGRITDTQSVAGVTLRPSSSLFVSNGEITAYYNRLNSDGDILQFRKNGSPVGSIGTLVGYLNIGTGDTGLLFQDDANFVGPWNTSTNAGRDAAIDLGTGSGGRFKDLYLSGGVYLGGAGAGDYLDDYEEGSWSATDVSGAGLSVTTNRSWYVKVGSLVTISASVQFPSTSNSTAIDLALPFTSNIQSYYAAEGTVGYNNVSATIAEKSIRPTIENAGTSVLFYYGAGSRLTYADVSGRRIDFTVSYQRT